MFRTICLLAVSAVLLLGVARAQADVIMTVADENATWPTSALIDTGAPQTDPGEPDYNNERDVKASRKLQQSFPITSEINLNGESIYIAYKNPAADEDWVVQIWEILDVLDSSNTDPVLGDQICTSIPLTLSFGDSDWITRVMKIDIDEDLVLPALPAPQGYVVRMYNIDDGKAYQWAGERDYDCYPPGRAFSDSSSSWWDTTDFSLAITPEPATLALLALGGLGVLVRRRK